MAIDIREAMLGFEQHGEFSEVYEVHSFEGYRETGADEPQTVLVKILDAGPDAGQDRYACEASTEDGAKVTRGNFAESVDTAMAITRWSELN